MTGDANDGDFLLVPPRMEFVSDELCSAQPENVVIAPQGRGYRRIFPFKADGELDFRWQFALRGAADPPEDGMLFQRYQTFTGTNVAAAWVDLANKLSFGTAFPLTPKGGKTAVYASARHVLPPIQGHPLALSWDVHAHPRLARPSDAHEIRLLFPKLHPAFDAFPDSPTQFLAPPWPDFCLLRCESDQGNGAFFVPSVELPRSSVIAVCGYPAQMLREDLVSMYRCSPALADEIFFRWASISVSHNRSIGVGPLARSAVDGSLLANDRVLCYEVSTTPGMSGGPVVDINTPDCFVGIHVSGRSLQQGDDDGETPQPNHNVGIRTTHPAFGFAYIQEVLPRLASASLNNAQRGAIKGFLDYHTAAFNRLGSSKISPAMLAKLSDIVGTFKARQCF